MSAFSLKRFDIRAILPRPRAGRWMLLAAVVGATAAVDGAVAAETTRAPHQAYLAADCVDGSNFCKFTTEAVAAGRRLEIQRVACQGWHSSVNPPQFVTIAELQNAAGAFLARIDFLETRNDRVNTNSVWTISESVLMFVPTGHRMMIRLNSASTGVGSYGCTISGYLVRL